MKESAPLLDALFELAELASGGAGTDQAAEVAVALIRGALGHEAGVTLRSEDGELNTLASSDPVVEECDQLQLRYGEGPFASQDRLTVSNDLATDRRWPTWGPAAASLGPASLFVARLHTNGNDSAFLTLYAHSPQTFAGQDAVPAEILAWQAAASLSTAHHITHLREAMEGRTVIGQAQGILMERCDMSADQAFEVLRRHSCDTNAKLRDVASRLIETGQLGMYQIGRDSP